MKKLRLPLLCLSAVLLLAFPASADMRGIPAADGHPQATIEGMITSVDASSAGGGSLVTLLGGLASFDAAGATVRFVNGTDGTTASLAAGQRILAVLDPTASPLKATTVVILADRADLTVTGTIEAVDTSARTLKILGLTARVTDRTVFGGPWDGSGQKDLADVRVGALALVDAKADSGVLVATKVMSLSSSAGSVLRIHGTVDAIGTDSWTIAAADGTKTVVKVDADTKVNGDPKVGDTVEVLARTQPDGTTLAVLIVKSSGEPIVPTERYQGVVRSIGATSWTIGPKVGDAPDRLFAVSATTKILGDPKVGDEVGVLAQKQSDGKSLAIVIAKVAAGAAPAVPLTEASFDGIVTGVPSGSSMGAVGTGTWIVDTTKVVVTRATRMKGIPKLGDKVHVDGGRTPDGTVFATSLLKL